MLRENFIRSGVVLSPLSNISPLKIDIMTLLRLQVEDFISQAVCARKIILQFLRATLNQSTSIIVEKNRKTGKL